MRTKAMGLLIMVLACASLTAGAAQAGVLATFGSPLDAGVSTLPGFAGFGVGHVLAGPVIAGDRVVWAQDGTTRAVDLHAVPTSGGAVTELLALPERQLGADHLILHLVGSPSRLAFFESQDEVEDGKYQMADAVQARIVAGPVGGPYVTAVGCELWATCSSKPCFGTDDVSGPGIAPMALSGDDVDYGDACGMHRLDLAAAPPALSDTLPGLSPTGTVLGPGVAVDAGFAVRRIADGTSLGSVPSTMRDPVVQADGKVAGYKADDRDPVLEWAAPGDTAAHELTARDPSGLQLYTTPLLAFAGDRLLIRETPDAAGTALALADLAGGVAPVIQTPGRTTRTREAATVTGATFDGTDAVWAVTRCEHTMVGISAIGDRPVVFKPVICDGPRVESSHPVADARGHIRVRVICGKACSGTLDASFPGVNLTVSQRFALHGAPRFHDVTMTLPPKVLRAVRRGPRPAWLWPVGAIDPHATRISVTAAKAPPKRARR